MTLRLVFTTLKGYRAEMKRTVVLVSSHSKNSQTRIPIGESGFAVPLLVHGHRFVRTFLSLLIISIVEINLCI